MTIESILNQISGFIWGPLTLIFLLGVGVYLMLGLKGFQLKDIGYGSSSIWYIYPILKLLSSVFLFMLST